MKHRWTRLQRHPLGRWLALAIEVAWLVFLVLLVRHFWDTPQAWFAYLEI
ncbi:MAG: hypothetical protein GXP62_02720 [Oligoflexia bacterium]|nr:hypothetical protein [Oligoflexia bacterium]